MLARVVLILPLSAALLAWSLALAVAGQRGSTTPVPEAEVVRIEPHPAEPEEPVAMIAVHPEPTPNAAATAAAPATAVPPRPVARVEQVARALARPERAALAAIIESAAKEFGQDPAFLVRVAFCESSLNPGAVGKAGEIGVFQFMGSTWARNAARLGYTPAEIWDVRAQARVTAEMFRRGQSGQWTCARLIAAYP